MVVLFAGFYIATLFGVDAAVAAGSEHPGSRSHIYARGTFAQIFALRAAEWREVNSFVFFLTRILGIFLFGLYLWRQGYLRAAGRTPRLVEARAAHRPAARPAGNLVVVVHRLDLPSQPAAADAR